MRRILALIVSAAAFSPAYAGPPPLDVKAEYGEQVATDIKTLETLKASGQVAGAGRCLKAYMETVSYEKKNGLSPDVKQRYRACVASCERNLPAATVDGARAIAAKYAATCRDKIGEPPPVKEAAASAPQGPVKRFAAKGACDSTKTKGACREFPSFGLRTEEDEKKVCTMLLGTAWVSGEGCPSEKLLGSCKEKETGQIQRWYDVGPNKGSTPAKMKDACDALIGTFQAP